MFYQRVVILCIVLFAPLLQASPSEDDVRRSVWVNEAIISTYTYDYHDLIARQQDIANYFTSKAWIDFSNAFLKSKLPQSVKKNYYYVSAVAISPPQIKQISSDYWEAVMPVLVVYSNPQYQQKQRLQVKLGFIKAPPGQGVRGYAITLFKSKVLIAMYQCPAEKNIPMGNSK